MVYQLSRRGQTSPWDYPVADRSRRKLIGCPLTFYGPSLHLPGNAKGRVTDGNSCTLFQAHRPGLSSTLTSIGLGTAHLSVPLSLLPSGYADKLHTRRTVVENRQKARQPALARADYSFFISTPAFLPLPLSLFPLSSFARTSCFCAAFAVLKLSDARHGAKFVPPGEEGITPRYGRREGTREGH